MDNLQEPDANVIQCCHSIKGCQAQYLKDSKELGVHLEHFDSDINAFQPLSALSKASARRPAKSRFTFFEEDGTIRVPQSSWSGYSPVGVRGGANPSNADAAHADLVNGGPSSSEEAFEGKVCPKPEEAAADSTDGGASRKKRRNRGRGGKKPPKRASRPSGGMEDGWVYRDECLRKRALRNGTTCRSEAFSLRLDASRTTTGWHGQNPPILAREEIRQMFFSGEIKEHLRGFYPIAESGNTPALLVDCEGILFAFRTSPADWLKTSAEEFLEAISNLIGPELLSEGTRRQCSQNVRGPHLPCIVGHYRPYQNVPCLTAWHTKNLELVDQFMSLGIVKRVITWVSRIVEMFFPGVAARFRECAEWHKEKYGVGPMFGLFFNLCINGIFPGQPRIFCAPHADSKNVVGVCALLIYQAHGQPFNHSQRCWIVLWEAGVVVELPPWVLFLYPSSLLYHFNIDVHDIQFVTTDGARPTRENSKPIKQNDEQGRGSLVFFNQASMYQSSETGYGSLSAARAAGMSGNTNFQNDIQRSFEEHGRMYDLRPSESSTRRTKFFDNYF